MISIIWEWYFVLIQYKKKSKKFCICTSSHPLKKITEQGHADHKGMTWQWNCKARAWHDKEIVEKGHKMTMKSQIKGMVMKCKDHEDVTNKWNAKITRMQQPNAPITRAWKYSQLCTLISSSPPLSRASLHDQNKWKMIYIMFFIFYFLTLVGVLQVWCQYRYWDVVEENCLRNMKNDTNYTSVANCHRNLTPNVTDIRCGRPISQRNDLV